MCSGATLLRGIHSWAKYSIAAWQRSLRCRCCFHTPRYLDDQSFFLRSFVDFQTVGTSQLITYGCVTKLRRSDSCLLEYQAPKLEVAIFAFPAAAAAGEVAGTAFLVNEHQMCTVYSARGHDSGKWEKEDTAKLAVQDTGHVTTEEGQLDYYYHLN